MTVPSSSTLTGPTAAGRMTKRYRLVFADHKRRDVSNRRRAEVAEHVTGWVGGQIIREVRDHAECMIVVEVARPVSVANAARFAKACPYYVADTFAASG